MPQETGLGPSPQTSPCRPKVQAAPTRRLLLNNLFVLRFNPVGLEDQLRLGIQRRLPDRGEVKVCCSAIASYLPALHRA